MRTILSIRNIIVLILLGFPFFVFSQASNDLCGNPTNLPSGTTCSPISGDLEAATSTGSPGATCVGATTPTNDVWFTFTATSPSATITVSGLGTNLSAATTYIELLTGTCGSLTSVTCQTVATSLVRTNLTVGTLYYVRVYVTGATSTGGSSNKRGFNICLVSSPNDDPGSAISLAPGSTCSTTAGTLLTATVSTGLPVGCESAGSHWDVWYKFTATNITSTISLSGQGANFTNPEIQLYSGTPGSLTSMQCGTTSITNSSLTIGTTYYVRVSNVAAAAPSGTVTFSICVITPPSNDECAGAIGLTPNATCSNTSGTVAYASPSAGVPLGCYSAGTYYDVWYSFTATQTSSTVTLSSIGTGFTTAQLQIYSGTCGALTSLQCGTGTTPVTVTGLTIGNTYYIRVSNAAGSAITSNGGFNICVTSPPSNDDCSGAITLFSNTTCSNTSATLASATPSAGIPLGCAAAGTYYDVWFTFVAANASETITTSGLSGSPAMQLFSGSCGALTSIACGIPSITATGLSAGTTYYVRVSNVGTAITSGTFNICVTHPAPTATTIDFGKSYVNISKNSGGGTVNPGDTLEIRATLVIKSGSSGLDSLAFLDTLHLGGGVRFIPGSIALRTNEGKIYKSFTDATADDAGYFYTSGTDTVVRINFGANASATARGKLLNTSKPSVFGSTCIVMATYRVVVYAAYGSNLNLGGGKLTGSTNAASGVVTDYTFSPRSAVVYSSPGLCPNAVSASNAIGGDNNGTFGSGTSQNRAPSANVLGYTYATFTTGNPQDYYYGIANNTSAGGSSFTTTTTWAKPDNSSPTHRVFNLWDITGDHTGATNTAKGNLPCDPTKPVSATNPCGYMLVVNSAYRTDTAFQYTVSNLCPNTYYEISAWFKNICYKCGCDSNGASSTTAGYIPSAPNDSSGVQPNITFDINGNDYYTTGNIVYGGLLPSTQTGSDSNNIWVKRGFTYLTGAAQTSLKLTIRNNAPGGGGNDWAMDDIALSTCLPNMQYSPSLSPTTCNGNVLAINDTIRSYFSNYQYYKWQRSTDGGTTWTDIPSANGTGTPVWNGSAWQYITGYTIPVSATNVANSGDKYRVVAGTTATSMSNTNCQVTDGVSQISLSVIDCTNPPPLSTNILSFNANAASNHANLYWTTNREEEQVQFEIERSIDGANFSKVGLVKGLRSANEINRYNFADTLLSVKSYYRISLINATGYRTYSRIVQLQNSNEFSVSNVTNFFESAISLDVNVNRNSKIDLTLLNASGNIIKQATVNVYNGSNNIVLPSLHSLTPGVYILQVHNNQKTVTVKAIKK